MQIIAQLAARGSAAVREHLPVADTWHPGIRDLIFSCWEEDPAIRPSFVNIHRTLGDIAVDMEGALPVEGDGLHK